MEEPFSCAGNISVLVAGHYFGKTADVIHPLLGHSAARETDLLI